MAELIDRGEARKFIAAIQQQARIGSLEPGKQADLIILNVNDYRHLGYRFGGNLVERVVKRGEFVV